MNPDDVRRSQVALEHARLREGGMNPELVRYVRTGQLSPIQAERLAVVRGGSIFFPPFEEFPTPYSERYWPLLFAVLWISWRDIKAIESQWRRGLLWGLDLRRDAADQAQQATIEDAETEIWSHLADGLLHANALGARGERPRKVIPSEVWPQLVWPWRGNGTSLCESDASSKAHYTDVQVRSSDVILIWPTDEDLSVEKPSPHRPVGSFTSRINRVGAKAEPITNVGKEERGGRVMATHWHDMWAEVCRIIHEEGVPPTRIELVKRMQQWFTDQELDAPINQTMKPIIDRLYRALKV